MFDFEDEKTFDDLPKNIEIGVICYGRGASMTITQMLIDKGFNAKNITGGIIRYALDVDTELLGNL
jgi:rhodanese-related sulfurtransferase